MIMVLIIGFLQVVAGGLQSRFIHRDDLQIHDTLLVWVLGKRDVINILSVFDAVCKKRAVSGPQRLYTNDRQSLTVSWFTPGSTGGVRGEFRRIGR